MVLPRFTATSGRIHLFNLAPAPRSQKNVSKFVKLPGSSCSCLFSNNASDEEMVLDAAARLGEVTRVRRHELGAGSRGLLSLVDKQPS